VNDLWGWYKITWRLSKLQNCNAKNKRVSKLSKGTPMSFEVSHKNTKSLKNKSKIAPNARKLRILTKKYQILVTWPCMALNKMKRVCKVGGEGAFYTC